MVRRIGAGQDTETSWQWSLDWSAPSIAAEIKAALDSITVDIARHGSPMGVYETFHIGL